MKVRDLMRERVLAVSEDDSIHDVLDMFVRERIHSAPVVDADSRLVGVITQTDVLFGGMTRAVGRDPGETVQRVHEVMTAPAVSVTETTPVRDLCRMMSELGLHRVPVVRDGVVVGLVSTLDICAAVAEAKEL